MHAYPYFAYTADPLNVQLDYALFRAPYPVVQDSSLANYNMFDATVDAFYSAIEKAGKPDVNIIVSKSGWPSAGNGNLTTLELDRTYK
ncbi:putative glucan endo-1,3-beta-D-glucosidase [Rosa chinensis]|uniref:glucan endo-1,3-beta-D-glucosidase n=1 Tax=Rosa chinensis TaxID=74649 RepID=A0A2P6R3R9_ROSCH|nr:putative glucan endo-1,3-beta-D-glucosidase [Rosa chinensis]